MSVNVIAVIIDDDDDEEDDADDEFVNKKLNALGNNTAETLFNANEISRATAAIADDTKYETVSAGIAPYVSL